MEKNPCLENVDHCSSLDASSSSSSSVSQRRMPHDDENRVVEMEERSPLYLIHLTISTGGLQLIWTTIMSQGSPYLASLGLPSSIISLIWLAGPLSGTLVQPYIGILSDSCKHPWGRRRPFIAFGTIITILCTLALPWTSNCVNFIFRLSNGNEEETRHSEILVTQIVAAMWIWALNIFIQPVQAGIRALIIDSVPLSQQVQASAYASCAIGVGSILGYSSGFVDLPLLLPWLGNTQLKGLCAIASIALGSTVSVSCWMIKEKKLDVRQGASKQKTGLIARLRELVRSFRLVPKNILNVFAVQFFAWLSWFPFLFYITTYIGDLYGNELITQTASTHSTNPSAKTICALEAARYGTLSLVFFATMALLTNLTLPHCVSTRSSMISVESLHKDNTDVLPLLDEEETSPTEGHGFLPLAQDSKPGLLRSLSRRFRLIKSTWLTLPNVWAASHIFRPIVLLSTALTDSLFVSTILVGLLGISWAMTQWVPFALISAEIARSQTHIPASVGYRPLAADYDEEDANAEMSGDAEKADADGPEQKTVLQAGTIMGMQNIAIATPQMAAAVMSSMLFWLLGRYEVSGGAAAGWVIRIVGLSGFVAAWLASKIESD